MKRGRTTDSETAGGYPGWTVTFSGPAERPTVTVDGDSDGRARGTVLIGRRVRITDTVLWSLQFAYTSSCANTNRCGRIEIVAVDPDAWERMSDQPDTEDVVDSRRGSVFPARYDVLSHVGENVVEPTPVSDAAGSGFAGMLQRLRGREVVLAVAWTGLHSSEESAMFREITLVEKTPEDALDALFRRLDLTRPGLEAVREAFEADRRTEALGHLAAYFRDRQTPRIPGDPRHAETSSVSAQQLAEADAALENRFVGQSKYGFQRVPDDIDWSFNPTQDPEWTWQFNRHSAWQALASAYRGTGDERYARKWVDLMRDWVHGNPPGTPWSWRTLEAGIRGMRWPRVFVHFLESPSFTPMDQALFLSSLADHADYLLPPGRFHSGSNWGQTESRGLQYIGTFFPEFQQAETWRNTAWERLENEMFRQVHPDGAQHELTTSYHQGTIRGFIGAADTAALGGVEPTAEYWQRLERMFEYTMILQKPDGTQPMLGDSWPGNTARILRAGAARFKRDDMLYVGTGGRQGVKPDFLDAALPSAGYYVMRTGWVDQEAVYALLDVAHHWGGGHQHPDALQINLYAYGRTLLPDSGSYLYYGPERRRFGRTRSHSTVTVDDRNQNTSPARLNAFYSSEALSVIDGEHSGYEGVTHRRQVLFIRSRNDSRPYFVVVDRILGESTHRADCYYHFLPGPFVCLPEDFAARTALPEGPNLLVKALPMEGLSLEEVPSEVSFTYTRKQPRPAIRLSKESALPITMVSVLVPYPEATPLDVSLRALPASGSASPVALEVSMKDVRDVIYASERTGTSRIAALEVSGLAGLVRNGKGEAVPRDVVCVDVEGISPDISRRWQGHAASGEDADE